MLQFWNNEILNVLSATPAGSPAAAAASVNPPAPVGAAPAAGDAAGPSGSSAAAGEQRPSTLAASAAALAAAPAAAEAAGGVQIDGQAGSSNCDAAQQYAARQADTGSGAAQQPTAQQANDSSAAAQQVAQLRLCADGDEAAEDASAQQSTVDWMLCPLTQVHVFLRLPLLSPSSSPSIYNFTCTAVLLCQLW